MRAELAFETVVPPALPPVEVAPDGALKRVIFGGPTAGRLDTYVSLGFDTRYEGGGVTWPSKETFEEVVYPNLLEQWAKYKMPLSSTILVYAIGDWMYNPPWFREYCGSTSTITSIPPPAPWAAGATSTGIPRCAT
jgi:hypothetical protein